MGLLWSVPLVYILLCNKLAYNFSDLKQQPFYYKLWFCGPGNWAGLSWQCWLRSQWYFLSLSCSESPSSFTYLYLSRIIQKSRFLWDCGLRDPHVVSSAWQPQSSWIFNMAAQGSQRDCSKKQKVETGNLWRPGLTNGCSATSSIFYWLK